MSHNFLLECDESFIHTWHQKYNSICIYPISFLIKGGTPFFSFYRRTTLFNNNGDEIDEFWSFQKFEAKIFSRCRISVSSSKGYDDRD